MKPKEILEIQLKQHHQKDSFHINWKRATAAATRTTTKDGTDKTPAAPECLGDGVGTVETLPDDGAPLDGDGAARLQGWHQQ